MADYKHTLELLFLRRTDNGIPEQAQLFYVVGVTDCAQAVFPAASKAAADLYARRC